VAVIIGQYSQNLMKMQQWIQKTKDVINVHINMMLYAKHMDKNVFISVLFLYSL